jgi:release factor glutamine methyltransferase
MSAVNIATLLRDATDRLRAAGVEEPRREARLLLALATGHPAAAFRAETALPTPAGERFEHHVTRRSSREPLAYLRGRAGFWDLELTVGPGVLVPRPETETLVEAALAALPDRTAALSLLDLGTGTGCLALTLLRLYPNARAVAVDVAAAAIACCADNAARLGLGGRLELVRGDWADTPRGRFDLIVSNPPYVADRELKALQPEVRDHEPHLALIGGPDGLDAYRALLPVAARRLAPAGRIILELGASQADAVAALLERCGLAVDTVRPDLAGIPRALVACRKPGASTLSEPAC